MIAGIGPRTPGVEMSSTGSTRSGAVPGLQATAPNAATNAGVQHMRLNAARDAELSQPNE